MLAERSYVGTKSAAPEDILIDILAASATLTQRWTGR
jgi:hypothetical protein